jgi:hypothetical protein
MHGVAHALERNNKSISQINEVPNRKQEQKRLLMQNKDEKKSTSLKCDKTKNASNQHKTKMQMMQVAPSHTQKKNKRVQ